MRRSQVISLSRAVTVFFLVPVLVATAGCESKPANPPPANSAVNSAAAPRASSATVNDEAPVKDKSGAAETAANATPLIPRDVLFGNPDKAMARMSHDGKRLAYLAPVEGVLN